MVTVAVSVAIGGGVAPDFTLDRPVSLTMSPAIGGGVAPSSALVNGFVLAMGTAIGGGVAPPNEVHQGIALTMSTAVGGGVGPSCAVERKITIHAHTAVAGGVAPPNGLEIPDRVIYMQAACGIGAAPRFQRSGGAIPLPPDRTVKATRGEGIKTFAIIVPSRPTVVLFASDTHIGQSIYPSRPRTALAWGFAKYGRSVAAVLHGGDLTSGTSNPGEAKEWLRASSGGGVPSWAQLLITLGNHDTVVPWLGPYDSTPESPHANAIAEWDEIFDGDEKFVWDFRRIRLLSFNANTDYIMGNGSSAYYNCNPPGSQHSVNPDHSGISIEGSPVRLWLDAMTQSKHLLKIGMCHRSAYAAFDSDPRKLNRSIRDAIVPAIDNGMKLLLTGDVHVTTLSGKYRGDEYVPSPSHPGVYSLTVPGGYVPRAIDRTVLPEYASSVLYANTAAHIAAVAAIEVEGSTCTITLFETTDTDPQGSEVFTHSFSLA